MEYRRRASGLAMAEGPVTLTDGGIICCEVLAGTLARISPSGDVTRFAMLGGGANGAAFGPDGALYVCNNGGLTPDDLERLKQGLPGDESRPSAGCIQRVDPASGAFQTLYDRCGDVRLIAPNDLVFDAAGGFYFTDYGSLRHSEPRPGFIYYGTSDGSRIAQAVAGLERPNGVGLSPDGKWLWVSESLSGRVWRLPVEAPGKVGQPRAPLHVEAGVSLDSLAVQADDHACIAAPSHDFVLRVAPDGGVQRIPTPPGGPSNICFGGGDMMAAFITHLYSGEVHEARWDAPGLRLNFRH